MKSLKERLGEVLLRVSKDTGATRLLLPLWAQVVGTTVARHARPFELAGGILKVRCESAAWRDALEGEREAILVRLQAAVGAANLTAIEFSCR